MVHFVAGTRLRNDLYSIEWDVKLYTTILYYTTSLYCGRDGLMMGTKCAGTSGDG